MIKINPPQMDPLKAQYTRQYLEFGLRPSIVNDWFSTGSVVIDTSDSELAKIFRAYTAEMTMAGLSFPEYLRRLGFTSSFVTRYGELYPDKHSGHYLWIVIQLIDYYWFAHPLPPLPVSQPVTDSIYQPSRRPQTWFQYFWSWIPMASAIYVPK